MHSGTYINDPWDLINRVYDELNIRSYAGMFSREIQVSHSAADALADLRALGGGLGAFNPHNDTMYGLPIVVSKTGADSDPIRII